MRLVNLLRDESQVSLGGLAFVSVLSGLSNALILVIVNQAVEDTASGSHTTQLLLLFAVVFSLFLLTRRHVLIVTAKEIERILHKIRIQIADLIRQSDLLKLEKIGRSEIFAAMQRETATISNARVPSVLAIQSTVLFFFSNIYLAWLSVPAFVIFNTLIMTGVWTFFKRKKLLGAQLKRSLATSNKLYETLVYVLDGFKEVKINTARSEDIFERIQQRSDVATASSTQVEVEFSNLGVFSQATFHISLATMVFLLPEVAPGYHDVAVKVVAAFLFIMGPVFQIVNTFPELLKAEAAAASIYRMEQRLEESVQARTTGGPQFASFRELSLNDLEFRFTDPKISHPFTVGPINLTIPAGKILFLAGGNGSGKSTLLRLLTALYRPHGGTLRVDDTDIDESNEEAYQNLFSVIFSDFYLFDQLYGLGEVDEDKVNGLIEDLGLAGKTRLINGEFETLDLSTGQRKRLALIVSLMEDKPICIFDEWAAEQDPTFRKRFYREILPELKAQGKTIIAVTHDDKYFDAADQLLQMDEGQLIPYRMG